MSDLPLQHADGVWIIVVAIILVVPAIIVAVVRHEKKRTEDVKAFARRLGMDFHEKGELVESLPFTAFPLFNIGRSRKFTNLLYENKGETETAVFDYRYTTGGGKNSHTHNQTVVAFWKPQADLPRFSMSPEHFFHKIGEKLGMQDIDFRGDPEFSDSYLLKGDNETAVRRLFEGRLVRFFARNQKWSVQGGDEWLVAFRASRRPRVEELGEFFKETIEVAKQFDFV